MHRVASASAEQLVMNGADATADVEHRCVGDPERAHGVEKSARRLTRAALTEFAQLAFGDVIAELRLDSCTLLARHALTVAHARALAQIVRVRFTRPVLGLALLAAGHSAAAQGIISAYRRGQELMQRHQLADAEVAFRTASRSATLTERAAAERALAVNAWRYHLDDASALAHLERALGTGLDTSRTLVEWSRFDLARGHSRDALAHAVRALANVTDDEPRRFALRAAAAALVEPYLRSRVDGISVPPSELGDTAQLHGVLVQLAASADSFPGAPGDALTLLHGALIVHDGQLALHAWHSYYLLDAGDTVRGILAAPRRQLTELFPKLNRTPLSRAERDRIVRALAASRMFDAAALVEREAGVGEATSPRAAEIVAYAAFARALGRATDEYYRRTLVGQGSPAELRRLWIRLTRELWPKLDWSDSGGAPPRFYPAAAMIEVERRFGAVVRFGTTAGYYDLHYGHAVVDDAREVSQYGHHVRVRLLVTDAVVSNGFQSWAWDGSAEHGGLQTGDTIIQVRTAFVENPFLLWLDVSNPSRQAFEARSIAADSAADWARAAVDSAGFLPGVRGRVIRDARLALLASLRGAGLEGDSLRNAFIREWLVAARESGVFAHEGRHAIDRVLVPGAAPDELEFRAKLSEVAFSRYPRIALGTMLHASIGDATAHGQANARVMLGLIRWMRAHTSSIRGIDASRPMLPQLPLLTEHQLREAFRSMDPLASRTAQAGSS